jgi:hypothetical protein
MPYLALPLFSTEASMDLMVPLVVGGFGLFLVTPKGTRLFDALVEKIEQKIDDRMLRKLKGKPIVLDD